MSRMPNINDLKKKFRERLELWCAGGIIMLLIDEEVKEGYLFHPSDILYPGTHENIIVILGTIALLNLLIKKRGVKIGKDEEKSD